MSPTPSLLFENFRFEETMSAWPGKYVIGLTGNIATGKSVVRKILEHLGAYGIDADALSHRAIEKGAPGYEPIVTYFGKWVLDSHGEIDRARLGRFIFTDSRALSHLEEIIHPLVWQGIDVLVTHANHRVIVIEAIKLLEGNLHTACDTVWVTRSNPEAQLTRLVNKRGMSEADARNRFDAQLSQEANVAVADVVINNDGSLEDVWWQVVAVWKVTFPGEDAEPAQISKAERKGLTVQRAHTQQATEIAEVIASLSDGKYHMMHDDVMTAFGEKAFMLLLRNGRIVGLVGWQVEDLVSRTTEFYLDPSISLAEAAPDLMNEVERASRELQSETSLLFLPLKIARQEEVWKPLGYEQLTIDALDVRAWRDAARESHVEGTEMLVKKLREDLVLHPL